MNMDFKKKNNKPQNQQILAWIFQLYTSPIISVSICRHYKNTHIKNEYCSSSLINVLEKKNLDLQIFLS